MADHAPRLTRDPAGLAGWLVPRDPGRLALLFLGVLLLCLAVGGGLGLVMRYELMGPERDLLSAEAYNLIFTLHGVLLVVFLLPAIPATLGHFVVPLQLGARELALPRVSVASLYLFVVSAPVLVAGAVGNTATGLPRYAMIAASGLGISAVLVALGLVVTVHRCRAPEMAWGRIPLFTLATYAGALTVLASALVVVGLTLREADTFASRVAGSMALDPRLALIPALGVVCEVLEVRARGLAIAALVALALVSVPLWSFDPELVGVARGLGRTAIFILLCTWLPSLFRGGSCGTTPQLYALAATTTLLLAGLTNLAIATVSEVSLGDTYFVVGSFHLSVLVVVLAFLAGLHHWWSALTSCVYNETAGKIGAAMVWIGVTTQGLAKVVLGHQGMPRRYYSYLPEYTDLHRIATAGAFLVGLGLLWTAVYLTRSWALRRRA